MNFIELQDKLDFWLNADSTASDQMFTVANKKTALNFVQKTIFNKLQNEVTRENFKTYTDITWPASQVTLVVPNGIEPSNIIHVRDITASTLGPVMHIDQLPELSTPHWADRRTMQWGTAGPSSAKTLRVTHYAIPSDMVSDGDTPALLPLQHHELIPLSAVIHLYEVAQIQAPAQWYAAQYAMTQDAIKSMSKGKPQYPAKWLGFTEDADLW